MKFKLTAIAAAIFGLFALMTISGSFYTIDETERGVKTRMGVIEGTVEPGFGWKVPFVESITVYNTTVQKVVDQGIVALSRDLQQATLDVAVNYSINHNGVEEIYRQLGPNYADKVIVPAILDITKESFGKFTALESVSQREKLSELIAVRLDNQLKQYGILIQSIQIQNVTFSPEFLNSVEERMKAEVEVQKVQQNLAREKVQADILRTQADATAYQSLTQAKAEAEGIRLKGQALKENSNLVELKLADKWDGVLPTTMIPNGATPLIDLRSIATQANQQ